MTNARGQLSVSGRNHMTNARGQLNLSGRTHMTNARGQLSLSGWSHMTKARGQLSLSRRNYMAKYKRSVESKRAEPSGLKQEVNCVHDTPSAHVPQLSTSCKSNRDQRS